VRISERSLSGMAVPQWDRWPIYKNAAPATVADSNEGNPSDMTVCKAADAAVALWQELSWCERLGHEPRIHSAY
jgi:hypothetical protein